MRPVARRALSLAPISLLLGGAMCSPSYEPIEPVKIGVLNPLSGELGSLGPSWEDASRLAAEQVNAAGGLFDGRPLELLFYDTETLPSTARAVAQEAIADGAVAIVGPASSGESAETVGAVTVPQISCCATSPSLTQTDDWFFRTTPNDFLQGKAIAHLAAEGRPAVQVAPCAEAAVVYRDDSYGTGLAEAFLDAYEGRSISGTAQTGTKIADVIYPSNAPDPEGMAATAVSDFMSQFEAAHDVANDSVCVLLVSFPPDGAALIQALQGALGNYKDANQQTLDVQFFGTDGLYDNAFTVLARASTLGVVGTAPTHAENDAYSKFRIAYHARFGVYPGNLTSNQYDAVMLLALAITRSGDTRPEAIREGLFDVSKGGRRFEGEFFGVMAEALLSGEDIDYVGPSGELDFDEAGDVVGDYTLWTPTTDNQGGYTIVESDFLPATEFAR